MKRMISALACAVAVLIWTCAPVSAEFMGRLKKNQTWSLEVTAASANKDAVSVTVVHVHANGTHDAVDSFSVPAPEPGTTSRVDVAYGRIPRGTRRVMIQVNVPAVGAAIAIVRQGEVLVESQMTDDEQLVWDVVDVP